LLCHQLRLAIIKINLKTTGILYPMERYPALH
jgi:hypothetical protein